MGHRAAGHDGSVECGSLDQDDFGSNRFKIINVIDYCHFEHDVVRKPLRTFRHHALDTTAAFFDFGCLVSG